MARTLIQSLCASLAALLVGPALAAGPSDPFSPPRQAVVVATPAPSTIAASEAASAASGPAPTTVVLSGLRTGATPRALIDGQWLALGERTAKAQLLAVEPDAAVLRHADGRIERLLLHPEAHLRPAKAPVPAHPAHSAPSLPRLARAPTP